MLSLKPGWQDITFQAFWLQWSWPWPDDLHIWTWPLSTEDLPADQKWTLLDRAYKIPHITLLSVHPDSSSQKHYCDALWVVMVIMYTFLSGHKIMTSAVAMVADYQDTVEHSCLHTTCLDADYLAQFGFWTWAVTITVQLLSFFLQMIVSVAALCWTDLSVNVIYFHTALYYLFCCTLSASCHWHFVRPQEWHTACYVVLRQT